MSDVGCRILPSRMSDVGCRMSDLGCRIFNNGSDVGFLKSMSKFNKSDVGCRIFKVGCRMAPISFRRLDLFWLQFDFIFRRIRFLGGFRNKQLEKRMRFTC